MSVCVLEFADSSCGCGDCASASAPCFLVLNGGFFEEVAVAFR